MAKAKAPRKSAKRSRKKAAKSTAKRRKRSTKKSAAAKPARKKARKTAGRKKAAASAARGGASSKPLTLTEVSKRTGISMPTLQRYKKEYQARLPTIGKGRTQRYPEEALPVFAEIKKENLKKRGRPRKSAAKKAKKAVKRGAGRRASTGKLISLSEIGRRTGISYPTLLRYVRLYGDRIPSVGTGRKRRFPPAAVAVFRKLRKESRRGRRKGAARRVAAPAARGLAARVRKLETRQAKLDKQLRAMLKALRKPLVKGV